MKCQSLLALTAPRQALEPSPCLDQAVLGTPDVLSHSLTL